MKKLIFTIAIFAGLFTQAQIDPNAPKKFYTGIATDTISAIGKNLVVGDVVYERTGNFDSLQVAIGGMTEGGIIVLKRNAIYLQDESLIMKDGLIINGNGAILKRGAQQTTTTTTLITTDSTQIDVATVPTGWGVGDHLQIYTDSTQATSSFKLRTRIDHISGNSIFLVDSIQGGGGFNQPYTWQVGATVRKIFPQITSDTLYDNTYPILLANYKIQNLTIDGNRDNNDGNYYWGVNRAVVSNAYSYFENCKFVNMPNECFYGTGFTIVNSLFKNLNGSALHLSGNPTLNHDFGIVFNGNIIKNTNEMPDEIAGTPVNGHNEGVINNSSSGGRMSVVGNRFLTGGECVLGRFSSGNGTTSLSDSKFVFIGNYAENFDKVIFDISAGSGATGVKDILITNNIFSNCGVDDWSRFSIDAGLMDSFKFYDNLLTDGTVITNIPASFQNSNFTEYDPIYSADPASGITSNDISNWNAKPDDSEVVHLTGDETISGKKTFQNRIIFGAETTRGAYFKDTSGNNVAGLSQVSQSLDGIFTIGVYDGVGGVTPKRFNINYNTGNLDFEGETLWDEGHFSQTDINNWNTAFGWGDHATAGYLSTETNDLTNSVTWADVPDANITQSSVTQHEGALSITESQISDLTHVTDNVQIANGAGYITTAPAPVWGNITGSLSNQTDLRTALNSKAVIVNYNEVSDNIELKDTDLNIISATYLTVTESQISDLDHYTTADFDTDFGTKSISDLADVNTSSLQVGEVLTWVAGGEWENEPVHTPEKFTISFDATEIANAATTPIQIVSAQGAGTYIVIDHVIVKMDFNTTAYDTDGWGINIGGAKVIIPNQISGATADIVQKLQTASPILSENTAMTFTMPTAPTAGDGVLDLIIYYRVEQF